MSQVAISVRNLQKGLAVLAGPPPDGSAYFSGPLPGPIDGIYGDRTHRSYMAYVAARRARGLFPAGADLLPPTITGADGSQQAVFGGASVDQGRLTDFVMGFEHAALSYVPPARTITSSTTSSSASAPETSPDLSWLTSTVATGGGAATSAPPATFVSPIPADAAKPEETPSALPALAPRSSTAAFFTPTRIAIGVGLVALVGLGVYFAMRRRRR